ncbi:MAG: amidohydrolase family protein [Gemmatimonadetes bacterium]|uniref:Amidohydrolase family protein n=1 Tax=Candidatus Kutchimonas denitrificans TaxID=3056748 RepID=A0AAE4ZD24_9BACT|nr:amidohydrolase family protein [Gemmatimonadota bacterium]NIR75805.1 amidohydrolase family protein [Candidatus Kutchimonas denitrificans]NIS01973.1 amidohydrolase family protein [Gemmatimonadota bacterium]NIT67777.1 amidohydrolase family protein [Gemmatimonadota bacterium]NIU53764.1 amidohydrolase family protein [Gemmatimonadota bacterium]
MMRIRQTLVTALGALAFAGGSLEAQGQADIAIVRGRVVDPASGTDRVTNVVIEGERIVGITDGPVTAERVIDASGLVVAPGFIDILARITPAREPQRYKIKDGVTTVINMHGGPVDIEAYYGAFAADGSLVNYGTTVGHTGLRAAAGARDRYAPATPEQIAEMQRAAGLAIEAGALGIGFGINYVPGSSYEEIIAMFEVASRYVVPAHVHSRYKGSVFPETIVQSVQELIAAAAITGASTQVVHLASSGVGSMAAALDMIEGARRHGIDIMADIYPYQANSTRLESALYDPGWQERFGGITYDSIMLVETGERLNEETFEYWREKGATIITFFIPKDEMLMALRHPHVMVASDGIIVDGKGHPRGAGTFARAVGRFVREEGYLTLMEALRKVTIMPAQRLEDTAPSMRQRGRLSVGAYADITIFDPNTLIDRATYREPARYSEGVRYVLVNGQLVLERGAFVQAAAPGKAIRHEN